MLNSCIFGDYRDGLRQIGAAGIRPQTVVTSPPYFGLRDYGHPGQLGLEASPDEYIAVMVDVFRAVREVLADDGTLWLNIGDSYANDGKWGGHTGGKHARVLHGSPIGRNKRYTGLKPKDLIGIPWMLAFALRADGWYLRQDIIWHKPNPMPESVRDRCTKAHEYLFLLSKSERYYFDSDAIAERAAATGGGPFSRSYAEQQPAHGAMTLRRPGPRTIGIGDNARPSKAVPNGATSRVRKSNSTNESAVPGSAPHGGIHREGSEREPEYRNRRSVWTIATTPYSGAHFATYPPALIEPCILAGSRPGDVVLDPFLGSGTTARVAMALGRQWIGCEINPEYKALQDGRTDRVQMRIEGASDYPL